METKAELYRAQAKRLVFSFLDAHTLGREFNQAHFWAHVLAPLSEQLVESAPQSDLAIQFALCQQNGFGTYTLEVFFQRLREANHQLILLLDEFDSYLHHPILDGARFFGGLRSLASRSNGALSLVIASRPPLRRLNESTQVFNPTGSPYLNVQRIGVGRFSRSRHRHTVATGWRTLLGAGSRLLAATGGHPFLLQASAAAMWDAPAVLGLAGQAARRRYVAEQLYKEHNQHFRRHVAQLVIRTAQSIYGRRAGDSAPVVAEPQPGARHATG